MKKNNILLLGGSGYVGNAFCQYFNESNIHYYSLSRAEIDYSLPGSLYNYLSQNKFTFLINAAGYTGKPNVDACEDHKTETLFGNAVLPGIINDACLRANISWGHMSSGCIFSGKRSDGTGFTEDDTPNFTFGTNNASFYSGTKALGEQIIKENPNCYIWRIRIPFNHIDSPRNYISKILKYDTLLDVENSISNLEEAVAAAYKCWEKELPFGIYHLTNPGYVTTRGIAQLLNEAGIAKKDFKFFDSEADFMQKAARAPRSSCVLDSSKLANYGIEMTEVHESLRLTLSAWRSSL